MTQASVDRAYMHEFMDICWEPNKVNCVIDKRFSLIVTRSYREVYVILQSGQKRIKLPLDVFNAICDSNVTVNYLYHFLESQHESTGLCCMCGLVFETHAECVKHEQCHTE